MKTYIQLIIASVGLLLLGNSAHAAVLITSFEADEGYINGATSPFVGSHWSSYGTGGSISNAEAFTGTQSLLRANGTSSVARRDFTLANNEDYDELTYSFFATGWSGFDVTSLVTLYLANEVSDIANSVKITTNYGDGNTYNQFKYKLGGDSTVNTNLPVATLDFNNWNTVSVSLNASNQTVSIALNGNNLASDVALPGTTNVDRIGRMYLYNSYTSDSVDVYYDTLTAVPEPGALALVMIGSMLLLPAFRRVRRNAA